MGMSFLRESRSGDDECGKKDMWLYWYPILESGQDRGDQGEGAASVILWAVSPSCRHISLCDRTGCSKAGFFFIVFYFLVHIGGGSIGFRCSFIYLFPLAEDDFVSGFQIFFGLLQLTEPEIFSDRFDRSPATAQI